MCDLVHELTLHRAYFAENQSSLEGLTQNILAALDDAVGLITIMHPSGSIIFPGEHQEIRASVCIKQEIAIATYISQILKRPLKIAAYIHNSIRREGAIHGSCLLSLIFLFTMMIYTPIAHNMPYNER